MTRARSVGLVLVLAAALGALTATTWVVATVRTVLEPALVVTVAGGDAAPAVGAAALVVGAAGLALALAGRAGRVLAAGVVVVVGVLTSLAAASVLADPQAVAIAAAPVVAGGAENVDSARATVATWSGVVVGGLTAGVGVWVALSARTWAATSRRHEPKASGPAPDDRGLWDSMSRGEDPTAFDPPNG